MNDVRYERAHEGKFARLRTGTMRLLFSTGDRLLDAMEENWAIVRREKDLFFGSLLFLLGLLDFHSGKYCDGNTADYLSCTRPVTYYYYTWLEIILIIVGVFFILLWFMKREQR